MRISGGRLTAVILGTSLFLVAQGMGRLIIANFATSPSPAEVQARHTLHFWSHLLAGRVLQACPCTRQRSGWEYYKAWLHAQSPAQGALAGSGVPRSPMQAVRDLVWLLPRVSIAFVGNALVRRTLIVGFVWQMIGMGVGALILPALSRLSPTAGREHDDGAA